jgi:hypothetical protein
MRRGEVPVRAPPVTQNRFVQPLLCIAVMVRITKGEGAPP